METASNVMKRVRHNLKIKKHHQST